MELIYSDQVSPLVNANSQHSNASAHFGTSWNFNGDSNQAAASPTTHGQIFPLSLQCVIGETHSCYTHIHHRRVWLIGPIITTAVRYAFLKLSTVRWHAPLSLSHHRTGLKTGFEFRWAEHDSRTKRVYSVPATAHQLILELHLTAACCPNTNAASYRQIKCLINAKAAGYGNLPTQHYCHLTVSFHHLVATWQDIINSSRIMVGKLLGTRPVQNPAQERESITSRYVGNAALFCH